ncbi:OsmC family protein [Natrialbaceae archaeon AArc-T1-2]|uniref:OsmC family protein n=1 Tax=Natrialbaceae archaeon AArc-T1-2 TaxID=3053904 RepID=UPI00255AE5C9|nr:OsmC family protein [Natrialbaceae archaeon AArc-T1-2]WIV68328.1 OsmC family protein [Natrialbaceae archaeon AArc-T1-2]
MTEKTYTLTGERISPRRTRIDADDAEFVIGEDASPVEYLLGSMLACLNATATKVASEMDLEVDDLTATVEGDIDYAAFLGKDEDARAGFGDLQITLDVAADADEETLEEWLAAVETRCPVNDTVQGETAVDVELA